MPTRHNLPDYERAGMEHRHMPVAADDDAAAALEELLALLRKELRSRVPSIHGDHATGFVAAVCAAHLHETRGVDPGEALGKAAAAGLEITPEARELVGAPAA